MPWRNRQQAANLELLDIGNWNSNFTAFAEDLNYPSPTNNDDFESSAHGSFSSLWPESASASQGLNASSESPLDQPLYTPVESESWLDQFTSNEEGSYEDTPLMLALPSTSPTYPPPQPLRSMYELQAPILRSQRTSMLGNDVLEGVSLRDMTVEDDSAPKMLNSYDTTMANASLLPHELKQESYQSPPDLPRFPSTNSGSNISVSPSAFVKPASKISDAEDADAENADGEMVDVTSGKAPIKRRRKSAQITPESSISAPPVATRNRHNLIEKRYRDSLQTRLLRLAQVLPSNQASDQESCGEKRSRTTSAGRKKSTPTNGEPQLKKAHILDEAVSYIEALEKQKNTMEAQNRALNETLKGVYEMVQQTWSDTSIKALCEKCGPK